MLNKSRDIFIIGLTDLGVSLKIRASSPVGAIAQLGERCNGIAEVSGSIPLSSTTL